MSAYKPQSEGSDSNLEPDNFSPEFYDKLDKIFLTKRALRELDRRNSLSPTKHKETYSKPLPSLARFARQGGPDITDLRGCPEPEDNPDFSEYASKSTIAEVKNPDAKRSSAYDANFVRIMAHNGVYMPDQPFEEREISTPENLDDIYQLMKRRKSLDPEAFTEEDFRSLKARFRDVSEGCVTHTAIPHLQACEAHLKIPSRYNDLFNNLQPIGDKEVVRPKPDIWDGIRAIAVHTTSHHGAPIVAQRQALNDGAYSSRANSSCGLPEYWMTRLDAYSMNTYRRAFVSGATAFRNIRELAWRNREDAVQAANAKVLSEPRQADSDFSSKDDSNDSNDERSLPPPSKRRKIR
ncbi:hypothetical protein F4779DRAFT_622155 [Xylariaceae sp. FL0662B]|nr:hypothetical protein F4779DRAFT_622155 [Xylariaceae sp. FL0662B]